MPVTKELTDAVEIPPGINVGVSAAKQTTMLALLGSPRSNFSSDCQPIDNPTLSKLVVFENVGPFKVRGLKPAIDSLREVMQDIAAAQPTVFAALGNEGMLCARFVRGSTTSISNHSWGTAVDLTIAGVLDKRGDNKVQFGLTLIAPIFNRHGWFWGAGFGTEDAMHFEVGDGLIRKWHSEGRFGTTAAMPEDVLNVGDRGPEVTALQRALNARGSAIDVDGVFGPGTRAAVVAFQANNGLSPTGGVDAKTRAALGM
jgi:hypothetical protein